MGEVVIGFEPAPAPFQIGNEKLISEHVFSEPIIFGTHGEDEDRLEAKVDVVESDIPKKAVDDWPEPKKIHNFYFINYRKYEDLKLREKIDRAKKELDLKIEARSKIFDESKNKKADRSHITSQLKELNGEDREFQKIRKSKMEDMEPWTGALGNLRSLNGGKGDYLCSSEEELDSLIRQKNNLIQHESNSLAREKELVNEIKQLEQTRKKVKANVAERKKVVEQYGKEELIQNKVKLMGDDYGEVKKDHQVVINKKMKLQDELKVIDEDIESLNKKLDDATNKINMAYENLQKLRKQLDEGNANHYKYRKLLNNARNIALKGDVNALKEFSATEVEKFIHLWNSSKGLRDDYLKRISVSLNKRWLCRDGLSRNPEEKPILEAPPAEPSVETASASSKTNAKAPKADSKAGLQNGSLANGNIKETALKKPEESFKIQTESPIEEEEDFFLPVKASTTEKEIDEIMLKRLKMQEQKEKYEQALKRKNKLAERKQRAVILSEQGATEKKLTKSEKKTKKGTISEPDVDSKEPTEAVSDIINEPGETVQTQEAPVPSKKNNTVRNRNLSKAPKSIPKAILKKKKATNYWMWGGAGILCLILLALIYQYLL